MKPARLSILVLLAAVTVAAHSESDNHFRANLVGIKEVPAIFTKGKATFTARAVKGDTAILFEVRYKNLSGPPTVAHVHFAQPDVNGGVSFFLCGGGTKPACPMGTSGSFSGEVIPGDVMGPTAQGIAAGDLGAILEMMREGVTYANIHTANFPGGEIRGRVKVVDEDDD